MNNPVLNRYKTSRQKAGITQERAAELLHVAERTLSTYENGHARPPDDVVLAMTEAYGDLSLGYGHMHDSPLGRRVLASHAMPETNGCAALKAWNASDALVRVVRKLKKLFRGKPRPADLCNGDRKEMAKKIDLLEQVRGEIVGTLMYLRQALFDMDARKEPPFPKRPLRRA